MSLRTHHSIFIFLFLVSHGLAQVEITGKSFMLPGDTLLISEDNLPSGLSLSKAGPDQYWDYTQLLSAFVDQQVVHPVQPERIEEELHEATLMLRHDGVESYFARRERGIYKIAERKKIPGCSEIVTAIFSPAFPYQKNLDYGDTEAIEIEEIIQLPSQDFQRFLRIRDSEIKEMRLRYEISLVAKADAWGIVLIPSGIYNVIRENRKISRKGYLEKKIGNTWIDMSLFSRYPEDLRRTESETYYFWGDETPEPVLKLSTRFDEVLTAQYKGHSDGARILQNASTRPDIFVYPNPSFGSVRFDVINVDPGVYFIEIFNILGVKLRTEEVEINGKKTIPLDFSNLKKGTYLYRLVDSDKNAIRSKRLVIITP